jgi:hypothetical protein
MAFAGEAREKWVYSGVRAGDDAAVTRSIEFMKRARDLGVTHILVSDGSLGRLAEMPPAYFEGVNKLLAAAKELDIQLVPAVFNIGYSGRYLGKDPNLAAGIPVRDAPFTVKGGVASPDDSAAPKLLNAGFDDAEGDKLSGWTRQDFPGKHTFVDTTDKHSGNASLKVTDLDKLPSDAKGACRVGQTITVKPFQYYRLSLWVKSENIQAEREDFVLMLSGNAARRHCYSNLPIGPGPSWTEERALNAGTWTQMSLTFNTFEATSIDFSVGVTDARGGTIWFDDLSLEPAGLALLVRRDLTPLVVTNEDKTVTYKEGDDFEKVPGLESTREISSGQSPARQIKLTPGSRIKEGQRLLVSYFHTAKIYNDQAVCSTQDPRILEIMEDQMMRVAKAWPTSGYMMSYDEIRIGGWEVQPEGENLTCGQILARHTATAVEYIRKYAPEARIHVWSDMYDPTHNARPFSRGNRYYYLCDGNWDGAWDGLPKDVVMINWNGTENAAESLKWFAGRGHKQVIAGYYDGDPKENLDMWMKASAGVSNVIGMMYTTWTPRYEKMPEFFRIYDEMTAAQTK